MKGWWVRYKFVTARRWRTRALDADRGGDLGVSAKFRRCYPSKLPAKAPERTLASRLARANLDRIHAEQGQIGPS